LPESAKLDGGDNPTGKQVTVATPKVATRSLWIMGISIILVLYVHTSMAPALTEMAVYFGKDYATISWVLTVYLVSGAAVTIVIGKLADTYGPKKMLLLVFVCYTVGTIFAGLLMNFTRY